MKKLFLSLLLAGSAAMAMAAGYTGVYLKTEGHFDMEAKTVTLTFKGADVLDGDYHIIEGSVTINRIEIYRSIGHDTESKVGQTGSVVVTNSLFDHALVWTDNNLPTPGVSGSELVNYTAYAIIGDYRSQGNPAGSFNIDYRNYPNPVSNLKLTVNPERTQAVITMNVPTHYTNGKEIGTIEYILLEKYNYNQYSWKQVKKFRRSACTPGVELSYEDNDIAGMDQLWYRATVYVNSGQTIETESGPQQIVLHSESRDVTLYLGEDCPYGLTGLKAEYTGSANVITWDVPTTGLYGGILDPSTLRYRVQRAIEDASPVVLADALETNSFTDTQLEPHAASYIYIVTPYNHVGTGSSHQTSVYGGAAYDLPFRESADSGIHFDLTGWTTGNDVTQNTLDNWTTSSYLPDMDLEEYLHADDEKGIIVKLLYPTNKVTGRHDYLTSAPINVMDVDKLTISLDFFAMIGYNQQLVVEVSNDRIHFDEVGRIDYENLTTRGWTTASWDVENSSDIIYLRLVCIKGSHSNSVGINNIEVRAWKPTGIDVNKNVNENVNKHIVNGTLVIERSGTRYDIRGTKLN